MPLVVASASLAKAVMPTVVPMAAFSSTLSSVASLSLIAVMSNSSRSVTETAILCVSVPPSPSLT